MVVLKDDFSEQWYKTVLRGSGRTIQSSSCISLYFGIFISTEKWLVNIRFPLPSILGKKCAFTLYRRYTILTFSLMNNRNNKKLKIRVV